MWWKLGREDSLFKGVTSTRNVGSEHCQREGSCYLSQPWSTAYQTGWSCFLRWWVWQPVPKKLRVPLQNPTQHEIFLPPKPGLSYIEESTGLKPVSILPAPRHQPISPVTLLCSTQASDHKNGSKVAHWLLHPQDKWHPPVDLEHLTDGQKQVVRHMVFEESDMFALEEVDIGCIQDLR